LKRVHELETRIDQHTQVQNTTLLPQREEFLGLAAELERVWDSPTADVRLKKRIVRTLIHEIVADVDAEADEVILVIHWKGGVHTELRLLRRRRGQNSCHTPTEVIDAVRILAHTCSDDVIAGVLNRNDIRTGRGNRWTPQLVTSFRSTHQIPRYRSDGEESNGWMNLTEAAQFLGVSSTTLRAAVDRAEIKAEHPLPHGPWVFARTALETDAAQELVRRVHRTLHLHKTYCVENESQ